ncbi:hypothetical protein AGMMS49990_06370 [Endomicrobiia bacterium]|nr:hypothetical protein AGMMS49990_06370 [Endomicrobiia bacterium]
MRARESEEYLKRKRAFLKICCDFGGISIIFFHVFCLDEILQQVVYEIYFCYNYRVVGFV